MAARRKIQTKRDKVHYVDNVLFLKQMIEYMDEVKSAKEADEPTPRVPDSIGTNILKIATHLSYKPNFINYTYRDDMISDGVENCLRYIHNFDPSKSKNPFAYFTTIIFYAFLRRIEKEKLQYYVRLKAMDRSGLMEQITQQQSRADGGRTNAMRAGGSTLYENQNDFIQNFEDNLAKKRKKAADKKKQGLEKFAATAPVKEDE